MTREEKKEIVAYLKERFNESNFFYIVDSSELTVAEVNQLRRLCHERGVEFRVAKNTLIRKAMEEADKDFAALYEVLKGPSSLFFAESSNVPAKIVKDFRKKNEKPILKAAFIETEVYLGDESLDTLAALKSKEELIGDIILLLQSPVKNVIGALQSTGNNLSGILKTLSEKGE